MEIAKRHGTSILDRDSDRSRLKTARVNFLPLLSFFEEKRARRSCVQVLVSERDSSVRLDSDRSFPFAGRGASKRVRDELKRPSADQEIYRRWPVLALSTPSPSGR